MVTVIPANPNVRVIPKKTDQTYQTVMSDRKLKVAAYCRVSTDSEEQESSYEMQCAHYRNFIAQNPNWSLVDVYADEGISGLGAEKRTQFMRLISDCMDGKVEMVITKSISRFARNTLDCLQYIRKLKDKGIPILFEKENILTTDAKGEIMITIMASIAQQESASISQNVQMGIRYRFREGKITGGHQHFLGYERTADASLRIIPNEAAIVRKIYRSFLEGDSPAQIAKRLTAEGTVWRFIRDGTWKIGGVKYICILRTPAVAVAV